ncbi:MAG: NERD domain-containing protein [Nitrospirae bacterium]|nr:NERD domain-containing protein [Nitrospirota bacterium]
MSDKINDYLMKALFFPLAMYSIYLTQKYIGGIKEDAFVLMVYTSVAIATIIFCFIKLWRLLKQRTALRLGLDCELAVGQELNHLMLAGCRIYHDFPAEKFNIDHIVVGSKGVFAIETKGRAKPDKKGGTEEAKVVYDGQSLRFPNWSESEPLEQAISQASWLSKWLNNAVGEPVAVQPVLALPGWYVVREKPADLFIFNGKNPDFMLKCSNTSLSETLINRIIYQVEQRCRDIEPVAYAKKPHQ